MSEQSCDEDTQAQKKPMRCLTQHRLGVGSFPEEGETQLGPKVEEK